jgi:peptide/nickel transport system permease protein
MTSMAMANGSARLARARRLSGRSLSIAITLAGLLLLTFLMGRLLPADPVLAVTGSEVDKATYDRIYQQLGLDRPVWQQFVSYAGNVLTGNLGTSLTTGRPVAADLLSVFPATLELAIVAILVGTLIGVPLGVAAAANRGGITDQLARIVGLAGYSVPIFWLGLMGLLLFYSKLQWVAASGRIDVLNEGLVEPITGLLLVDTALRGEWEVFRDALAHIILPGAVLGYYSVAYISRMTRSFMLEQLSQEYITAARAKGVSRRQMIWKHAFKNIRVQLLTVLGLTFGGLIEGAVLIETVFGWPGLGQYLTRGLTMNDMNVVMGSVLLTGAVFIAINVISDRLYRILDPRTR